jgi:hypothetical protein
MPKKKSNAGRPTVMTKEVLAKLEHAFALGCSDGEACFYADISKQSLYDYQNKYPEFTDRKEALKEKPILIARQTVVKNVATDPDLALKFLERKRKKEFSTRTEQDHNHKIQNVKDLIAELDENSKK